MDENFEPTRKAIDLSAHVGTLPTGLNMDISEIVIPADTELVGVFDGLYERTLKEPNKYTGKSTDTQISMILSEADNPDLVLNEGETGSVQRYVWASPGLCRELQESEVIAGGKIKIKRKHSGKKTSWKVIPLN